MGVVHLARRGDGHAGRAQGAAPPHRRRRGGAAAARPRGQLAVADPQPRGSPRSSTPTRGARSRTSPPATCPGLSLHELVAGGGPAHRRRPALARRLPGRGRRVGPRRRRAAPRRQAVQRADGGADPDPHRLRPGPGRRRPAADPHRLAARHARLPRARDPVRRRRHDRLRRPLLGGDRRASPAPAGRRSAAARRWRSWTGSAAASTTSPACRDDAAPRVVEPALDPDPRRRPDARPGPRLRSEAGRCR